MKLNHTHSLTNSLSLTHSITYSLTHSLSYSLTDSLSSTYIFLDLTLTIPNLSYLRSDYLKKSYPQEGVEVKAATIEFLNHRQQQRQQGYDPHRVRPLSAYDLYTQGRLRACISLCSPFFLFFINGSIFDSFLPMGEDAHLNTDDISIATKASLTRS